MGFCTEIVCDGCSMCITRGTIMTKGNMIRIARKQGWSVGNITYALIVKRNLAGST